MIAAERIRQVHEEGWSPKHDDQHRGDQLALAAACYAAPKRFQGLTPRGTPWLWPWDSNSWKPTPNDRVRELVKAGALIAAEIDRLMRAKGKTS